MASKWTVKPAVDRYELELDGEPFWVDLKRELTTGERNKIRASGIRSYSRRGEGAEEDVEANVSLDLAMLEKIRVWVADWSLSDEAGNKLPPRDLDTLRALRTDVFDLIDKTVEEHAKKREAMAGKKGPSVIATSGSEPPKTSE